MQHKFVFFFLSYILAVYSMNCPNVGGGVESCTVTPNGGINSACTAADPCNINRAASIANNDDIINLAPGTYVLSSTADFGGDRIQILGTDPGTTIISGGGNFQVLDLDGDNLVLSGVTLINGGGTDAGALLQLRGNNDYTVQNVNFQDYTGNAPSAIFMDNDNTAITFSNCNFFDISVTGADSSIIRKEGSGTFSCTNCMFQDLAASQSIISHLAGGLSIGSSSFSNCVAGAGGSISVMGGTSVVTDTSFTDNVGAGGGAVFLPGGTSASFTNCDFSNNVGFSDGGAINSNIPLTLTSCTFNNNQLTGIDQGGAIFSTSTLMVMGCTFNFHSITPLVIQDRAVTFSGSGGTIYHTTGAATILGSSFQNSGVGASGNGAAIFINSGSLTITNTSLDQNMVGIGAIYVGPTATVNVNADVSLASTPVDLFTAGAITWDSGAPVSLNSVVTASTATLTFMDQTTIQTITGPGSLNFEALGNQIVSRFDWGGGTIGGAGDLRFPASLMGEWGSAAHIINIPTVNLGLINLLSGPTPCATFGDSFGNTGVFNVLATSTTPCAINGAGSFSNNGTFRGFGAAFMGTLTITLSDPGTTFIQLTSNMPNAITHANTFTVGGNLGFERVFPFWPRVTDSFTVLNGATVAGTFNSPTLNLVATLAGNGNPLTATVTATPTIINDDMVTTDEDTAIAFNPLINDFAAGGVIQYQGSSNDTQLVFDSITSLITYTPPANVSGLQTFTYTALDETQVSGMATINIMVNPINDPPNNPGIQSLTISENPASITIPGTDVDNEPPSLQFIITDLPTDATLSFTNGTAITELPALLDTADIVFTFNDPSLVSADAFGYMLFDGEFTSEAATLTVSLSNDNNTNDNTPAIVGGVVGGSVALCCIFAIVVLALFARSKGKKQRGKKALENFLARQDLPLVLALVDISTSPEQRTLALYFTQFFSYYRANARLLSHFVDVEVSNCEESTLLFRENTFSSKLLKTYAEVTGINFLKRAVGSFVSETLGKKKTFELDPSKVNDDALLEKNQKNFLQSMTKLFDNIMKEIDSFPQECRDVCTVLYEQSESKWANTGIRAVSSFIFLRWICPAMLAPKGWGIASGDPSKEQTRILIFHAKLLQSLANGQTACREPWLKFVSPWLQERLEPFNEFLQKTWTQDGPSAPSTKKASYDFAFNELHKTIIAKIDDLRDNEHLNKDDSMAHLNKILIYLGPPDDDIADEELQNLANNYEEQSMISGNSQANSVRFDTVPDSEEN